MGLIADCGNLSYYQEVIIRIQMSLMSKLKPRTSFAIVLVTCLAVSLALGWVVSGTSSRTIIGGPISEQVMGGKDLVADILPPPHYIVESLSTAAQLLLTSDTEVRDQLIETLAKQRNEYEASQKRWQEFRDSSLSNSHLANLTVVKGDSIRSMYECLLVKSHAPAMQFFDDIEQRFVPALKAGDSELAKELFNTRLKPLFDKHREGIDETVGLANGYNEALSQVAIVESGHQNLAFYSLLVLMTTCFVGIGCFVFRILKNVERSANEIAAAHQRDAQQTIDLQNKANEILTVANKVAQEDYTQPLTVCGADVIGKLGEGLAKFFADKQETELREQQRADREREQAEDLQRKVAVVLQVVNSVASGRFDVEIPNLGNDEIGQVATALSQAVNAMKSALSEVRDVSVTVSSAAEQLSAVVNEITAGAQTQASSLEETASSLEEITSTVKQNTDNAQQARQFATGSRDIAEKGGAVVNEAVQAMSEINQSSKRIADIITTIDEIAFQTNLLALNAAVEAARAGEQGRGFAVVAAEVRNLAQRSASSAKEIKALIHDSVRKVENGTDLVNKSGQTLSEIVGSVKRVTDIVSEIAAASREQLTGVEQVNKAVSQMDRVTQSNASQTEEMSGTATALLSHAVQLRDLVGRFQLDDTLGKAVASVSVPTFATIRPRESEARPPIGKVPLVLDTTSSLSDVSVFEF